MNKIKLYGLIIVIFTTLLSLIPTLSYGATVVSGAGIERNPYVINMDLVPITTINIENFTVQGQEVPLEAEVKKEGFWFEFEGNSSNGTYYVNYNKEEKKVTFIKINNEKFVITGDPKYFQAGTVPKATNAEDTFENAGFIIKTAEIEKGAKFWNINNGPGTQRYQLKNAPRPLEIGGAIDRMVPDPSCFVFAKSDSTVESLYKPLSELRFPGDYVKYTDVFGDGKVADLKLYTITGLAGTRLGDFVVRFAKYRTENDPNSVYNQDNYKLELKYQFVPAEEPTPVEKAGIIETAITWILLAVGQVFMFAIKLFLGDSVTIDSIIFNRYTDVIIDLRGRVGPFSVPAVKDIINSMYTGFEFLAIFINIVVLLYIGVQIVMSVGTDKQSKYTKNLQNWVVGVLILFLAPQFFPFLTDITNGIVSYIGKDTQPMYTQYNIVALLDDEDLLGENAQTVDLVNKINEKITGNEESIAEKEEELAEKQTEIDAMRTQMEAKKAEIEQKQSEIQIKLSDTSIMKRKLNDFDAYIDSLLDIPMINTAFRDRMNYNRYIDEMLDYVEVNKNDWDAADDANLQVKLDEFENVWKPFEQNGHNGQQVRWRPNCNCNLSGGVPPIVGLPPIGGGLPIISGHTPLCDLTSYAPYTDGKQWVIEIKTLQLECARLEREIAEIEADLAPYDQLQAEIDELQAEIDMLIAYQTYGNKADLMTTMRKNAGETGRVIYAIVWLILIFQMITLLAMYYKRIIMVAILLMIFPIVMIAYALDKINDGAAQTLENWTKEFTINILVQIAHAVVYVTLIQTGLDIYASNQDNWLFLLVAVLFLFPGERLLRSIFGLNGNTIGTLKANIGGAMAMGATAGVAAFKLGKGAVKGAKAGVKGVKGLAGDIKNKGVKGTASDMWKNTKKSIKKGWENLGKDDAKDAKDKKRQAVADRKKRARDTNIERRREQMKTAGAARKAMLGAVNAASHVRNGMYKIGNAGRKVKRSIHGMKKTNVGKTFKLAGKGIKGGIKGMRKVAGATMGIATGVTNGLAAAGNNGVAAGLTQGIQQGTAVKQLVGGPSAKPKQEKKEPKDRSMNGNTPLVKKAKHMPGGQKYKRANSTPAAGKQREGVRGVGKTSRKIRGTRKVNRTVNKKTQVKESDS